MPSISAGGAVEEPLPSIWMRTFGIGLARKASAQNVIRLFSVSEPIEFRLPATPLTVLVGGNPGVDLDRLGGGGERREPARRYE